MRKFITSLSLTLFSTCVLASQRPAPKSSSGLGDLSEGLTAIMAAAGEALSYILLVAGIAFIFGSIIKYMAHRANPSQVRLSEPFFLFVLGLALIALPFVQYVVGYNPGIF